MSASNAYSFPSRHQRRQQEPSSSPPEENDSLSRGCDPFSSSTKKGISCIRMEKNSHQHHLSPLIIYEQMTTKEKNLLEKKRDFDHVTLGVSNLANNHSNSSTASSSRRGSGVSVGRLEGKSIDDFLSENPLRKTTHSLEEPYSSLKSRSHFYVSPSVSQIVDSNTSATQTSKNKSETIFHTNPSGSLKDASYNWKSIDEESEDEDSSSLKDAKYSRRSQNNPLFSSLSSRHLNHGMEMDEHDLKVVLL